MPSAKVVSVANPSVQTDLLTSLERRAASVCAQIEQLCHGTGPVAYELQDKFLRAVSDIKEVAIGGLPPSEGSFSVANDRLTINEEPVAKLLDTVVADLRKRVESCGRALEPTEIPAMMERVLTTYMLHELRHRSQGVGSYSVVKAMGNAVGKMPMAEFDMTADRDAAFACAALLNPSADRAEFLVNFREALYLSHAYFFKVFPVEGARADKVSRAIAVMLMIARLIDVDPTQEVVESKELPLDAPLTVHVSLQGRQLAVFCAEPSRRLLFVANDEDGVGALIQALDHGDMDLALRRAFTLWRVQAQAL